MGKTFELSREGRLALYNDLGPVVTEIVEEQLKDAGYSAGFRILEIAQVQFTVPDSLIDEFEAKMNDQCTPLLKEWLKEDSVTKIDVVMNGNTGVMKCIAESGKEVATFNVTSGVIPGKLDPDLQLDIAAIPEGLQVKVPGVDDFTIEGAGPIPPGTYYFDTPEITTGKEIGKEFTVVVGPENIASVSKENKNTIVVVVDFETRFLIMETGKDHQEEYQRKRAAWGTHMVKLKPSGNNKTYGRKNFYIHGGDYPGSAGCIDLGGSMGKFVEVVTLGMAKRTIQVNVVYSK